MSNSLTEVSASCTPAGGSSPPGCHDRPPEQRTLLALAQAIARPGTDALFLDEDNRPAGWAPLDEAAASGRPYCVEVAPGLLALDVDRPDADVVLAPYVAQVAAAGALPVVVASGRKGHRHLLARVPRTVRRSIEARARRERLDRIDVRSGNARLRPPLSPHRLGFTPRLIGTTPAAAIAALAPTTGLEEAEPLRWDDLLRSGQWPIGYRGRRSGSEVTFAVARGAIRAGWDRERLRLALADPANHGGECYRRRVAQRGQRQADRWLAEDVWPDAEESAKRQAITCRDDVLAIVDEIDEAVEAERWPGVGGASMRSVLLAIVDAGRRQGSIRPYASHRALAEAAGVNRSTIPGATRRLIEGGWLQVVRNGGPRTVETGAERVEEPQATTWRLLTPPTTDRGARSPATSTGTGGCTTRGGTTRAPLHDACRWGNGQLPEDEIPTRRGLGLNVPRVLAALADGPLRASQVAEAVAMDPGHMRARLLPKLGAYGLVVRLPDGRWQRCEDVEGRLDATAKVLGLTGKAGRQRAQHEAERDAYLDWRVERRPERAAAKQRAMHPAPPPVDPETGEIADLSMPPPAPPPGVDPATGEITYLACAQQARQAPLPPHQPATRRIAG